VIRPRTAPDRLDQPSFIDLGGRRIAYAAFGAPDGRPVLALHGTPGSRFKYASVDRRAAEAGLRLISVDRWGYGASDVPAAPSLSQFADDMMRVTDRLGIGRFSVIAISGGAPYAAAVAALAPDRVERLALVSPLGPTHGLAFRDMRLFHHFCFRALPRMPGLPTAIFRFYRRLLFLAPQSAIVLASLGSVRTDRVLVRTPAVRNSLAVTFREGLRENARGGVVDLTLFSRPWGVDLSRVRAATRVWHGTADRNVPQAAARRLADLIPGAELTLLPDEGHFWISDRPGDVLAWLAAADAGP
jgi:pimeloyl-ACP methyl ester carboxylesterase